MAKNMTNFQAILDSILRDEDINSVDFSDQELTLDDLLELGGILIDNKSITKLNLSGNELTIDGLQAIIQILNQNKVLVDIDLSNCGFSDDHQYMQKIKQLLKRNCNQEAPAPHPGPEPGDIKELKREIKMLKNAVNSFEHRNTELEHDLEKMKKRFDKVAAEKKQLGEEFAQFKKQQKEVSKAQTKQQQAREQELLARQRQLDQEIKVKEGELQQKQKEIRKLQNSLSSSQAKLEKALSIQKDTMPEGVSVDVTVKAKELAQKIINAAFVGINVNELGLGDYLQDFSGISANGYLHPVKHRGLVQIIANRIISTPVLRQALQSDDIWVVMNKVHYVLTIWLQSKINPVSKRRPDADGRQAYHCEIKRDILALAGARPITAKFFKNPDRSELFKLEYEINQGIGLCLDYGRIESLADATRGNIEGFKQQALAIMQVAAKPQETIINNFESNAPEAYLKIGKRL